MLVFQLAKCHVTLTALLAQVCLYELLGGPVKFMQFTDVYVLNSIGSGSKLSWRHLADQQVSEFPVCISPDGKTMQSHTLWGM